MYVRVFSAILDSSIWQEELHVRCLWLTMMIIADENRDGTVNIPLSRLAQKANLSEEQTAAALEILMAPDPDSDSPEEDGRRIVPLVPDRLTRGWRLVNWLKYKKIASDEHRRATVAENMRRYRAKAKNGETVQVAQTEDGQDVCDCCENPLEEPYGLYVVIDHDHTTGKPRGRICQSCNAVVGRIERGVHCVSPKKDVAIAYIERHSQNSAVITPLSGRSRGVIPSDSNSDSASASEQRTLLSEPSAPTPQKPPRMKKLERVFKQGDSEYDLSLLLLSLIQKRNPQHNGDLQKWARHIEWMIYRDGRTWGDIRRVIEWCQADDFWQNNILSTEKLRKQFDQLLLKSKAPNPKAPAVRHIASAQILTILERGEDTE